MKDKLKNIGEYIEAEVERYKVPGMALSVNFNGENVLSQGFGFADLESEEKLTGDHAWCIASCSKAFTSALIAILVDKGLIDYDTPIVEYLPDFKMDDEEASAKCTIRDMLMHRTGLSEHDALWCDTIDRAELYKRLAYLKSRSPFRKEMIYNNTVYTLIGAIAEKVSGLSWEEMIREWIFKPLGMDHSVPCYKDIYQFEKVATPYWNYYGIAQKLPVWDLTPGDPCAGISTHLDDAMKWLEFNCNRGKTADGVQLISEKQMDEMHKKQIDHDIWKWEWPGLVKEGGYGLGWFCHRHKGHDIVFHTGEIEGYCTLFAFVEDVKLCFAAYINMHHASKTPLFSVFYTVMDELLDLPKTDWATEFAKRMDDIDEMRNDWDVDLVSKLTREPGTSPSLDLNAYTGKYWHNGYGEMSIVTQAAGIKAIFRGNSHPLEHFHYDTFLIKDVKEDTLVVTAPVEFVLEGGKVLALKAKLDPGTEAIEFTRK
ncbi:MAG: serine hydrolase [Clostridia bacterium]|nr:serine hydrolase [Clostridia bacterium]